MTVARIHLPLLLASALSAAEPAWYLDLNAAGTGVVAKVNGFPLFEDLRSPTSGFSSLITPYLRSGKNEFTFTSIPRPEADIAWLEIAVASAPVDVIRTAENEARLFHERLEPLSKRSLATLPEGSLELLAGTCDPGTGPLEFVSPSHRRWCWGARLTSAEHQLKGIPYQLSYSGLAHTLVRAELHLLDSKSGRHLVFDELKLSTGGSELALDPGSVSHGRQWLGNSTFDTVWLFGVAAEGVEEIRLGNLSVHLREETRTLEPVLEIEVPHEWSWASGEAVREALADPARKAALIEHIRQLHQTMGSQPAEAWEPFFETKLIEMAESTGRPLDQMRENQRAFFQSLTSLDGWALESFDPARLLLVPINDRVVQARYVDSLGPIESVPLVRPGATKVDRFTVPLFLSLIDGKWTVVR